MWLFLAITVWKENIWGLDDDNPRRYPRFARRGNQQDHRLRSSFCPSGSRGFTLAISYYTIAACLAVHAPMYLHLLVRVSLLMCTSQWRRNNSYINHHNGYNKIILIFINLGMNFLFLVCVHAKRFVSVINRYITMLRTSNLC